MISGERAAAMMLMRGARRLMLLMMMREARGEEGGRQESGRMGLDWGRLQAIYQKYNASVLFP